MGNARQLMVGVVVAVASVATLAAVSGDLHPRGAAPAQAAQAPPPPAPTGLSRYLRFTGTGTARVKPDTASIWFSTSGESSVKASAVNAAGTSMRRVIAALHAGGVAHPEMQTSSDVYHDTSRGLYEASESLQITIHRVDAAGKLVAVGLNAGADSASGPEFSLASQNAGYDAALRAAMTNARSHAEAAAALAGVRLTGVVSVDDVPVSSGEPLYLQAEARSLGAVAPVPTQHGMQDVSVTVTVTYAYAGG
jgi:uncharacterized protein